MKKEFVTPDLIMEQFEVEDVITTSNSRLDEDELPPVPVG